MNQSQIKLKTAMEEVKEILSKHDIAAMVVLHTPGHSEYLISVSPSYSCATFINDELRVKASLKKDFNGNKDAWIKKVSDTANMIHHLAATTMNCANNLKDISDLVDNATGAEHIIK